MKRLFLTFTLMLMLMASASFSFYGDLATDTPSFTLGVAGQNANQITSMTALFPIESANGWGGVYVSRQSADGMVVSETVNAHLQGGFRIRGIGIEAYIDSTRDKWRAIDFALETGYFIRPGTWTWNEITLSGGIGNYTERRDLDDEIGRDKDDISTKFGVVSFVSAKWKNLSGVVRYKPSLDFAEEKVEASLAFTHELNDEVAVGITTQSVLDSESVTDSDVHTSYLVTFTYTPKK